MSIIQYKIRKWAALSSGEQLIFVQAFFLLPVVRLCRWMHIHRLQKILGCVTWNSRENSAGNAANVEASRHVARLVSIASHLFKSSCLERSLALWTLLRWRGIESDLQIGVRKEQGKFAAHAWVEIDGVAVNDADDVRERFATFPLAITSIAPRLEKTA